jgi:hypothetical protein
MARKSLAASENFDIQGLLDSFRDESNDPVDLDDPRAEAAAITIQAGFKGMLGRQRVARLTSKEDGCGSDSADEGRERFSA